MQLKPNVIDIFAHTKDREHLILRTDRAVDVVSHLDQTITADDDCVFLDPFCKAGELLLATALLGSQHRANMSSVNDVGDYMYLQNKFHAITPDEISYYLTRKVFCDGNEYKARNLTNACYLHNSRLDKDRFKKIIIKKLEKLHALKAKKIIVVSCLPCQRKDNDISRYIYNFLFRLLTKEEVIDQLLVVVPERWFVKGIKFTELEEIKSGKVKYIRVKNSRWLFPNFGMREGLCYVYFDREYGGSQLIIDKGSKQRTVSLNKHSSMKRIVKKIVSHVIKN